MMRRLPATFYGAILLSLGLAGCARHPEVTVRNLAGVALREVVISGNGFEEKLGDIAPGGSAGSAVRLRGASGLRVAFKAEGKRHLAAEAGYFEGSGLYRVTATVAADFSVAVEAGIGPGGF